MKKVILGIAILVLVLVAVFVVWAGTPLGPMPEALQAMNSSSTVEVSRTGYVTFKPVDKQPEIGFIFYPGGRVDFRSYAPYAAEIASNGYQVFLVPMPLSMAVFNASGADVVIQEHPEIKKWVIGGHSLGGAMAANYVFMNPEKISGVVFWAAYPAENNDLSGLNIPTASILGTKDGLADTNKFEETKRLIPADTTWTMIEGGNHAQMGWYGKQPGDGTATITREEQQIQVVAATIAFLNSINQK